MVRFAAVALFLSALASSQAFMVTPVAHQAPHTQLSLMATEDVDNLLAKAGECAEGTCSVDDINDLVDVLEGHKKELYSRIQEIKEMRGKLVHVNEKDEREVDEVRETVRALFRVFQLGAKASNNDYPALSRPTGWSGEVGDGPKTAYDALPPKQIKK